MKVVFEKGILHFILYTLHFLLFTLPSTEGAFMDTGLSARGAALGGAYASLTGSSDLIYYNPAGLKGVRNPSVSFYYHKPFSGLSNVNMNTGAFSFAMPVYTKGVLGLGYTQFSAGDDEAKLYQEASFSAALSYDFSTGFAAGAALKNLSHEYFPDDRTMSLGDPAFDSSWEGSALTADAGINARLSRTLNFGLAFQNFIKANVGIYDKDIVPSILRIALNFTAGKATLAVGYDIRNQDWGKKTTTSVGGEWRLSGSLSMRAGYNNDETTFGFGLNTKIFGEDVFSFNYGYSIPSDIGGGVVSHRLGVSLKRGEAKEKPEPEKADKKEDYWKKPGEEIEIK